MANADTPRGCWPVRHLTGGEIRTNDYIVTTSATIYKGDPVELDAAGTISAAEAGDATAVTGVAADYISSAVAGSTIPVWDDPNIVFGIQEITGGTIAATEVGASADAATYAAGSSTTGISAVELSSTNGTTAAQFMIIGKLEEPNNAWGEHCDVLVIFNEHRFKGSGSAGV